MFCLRSFIWFAWQFQVPASRCWGWQTSNRESLCLCSKQTLHRVQISLVEVCRAWDNYKRHLIYRAPQLKMFKYWSSSWFAASLTAWISCWIRIIACLAVRWKQNMPSISTRVLPIVGLGRVGKRLRAPSSLISARMKESAPKVESSCTDQNKLSDCSSEQSLMLHQWLNPGPHLWQWMTLE